MHICKTIFIVSGFVLRIKQLVPDFVSCHPEAGSHVTEGKISVVQEDLSLLLQQIR